MEKQLLPALAVLVFCVLYTAAIAAQTKSTAPLSVDKTRGQVQRLGFGKRVTVRLQNGTKARGRLTGLSDDQFVVTDSETGASIKVAYADVASISKRREMPRFLKGAFTVIAVTAAIIGSACVLVLAFLN
jgi:small nuclear ribonucleoprotein (snRNP)-like protein